MLSGKPGLVQAGHLVHVVRNRANYTLQLCQLLGQLLGGLGPPVMRGECQALDIGRDREPRGLRPPRNAAILGQRKGQVHALGLILVLLAVISLVVLACHRGEERLKGFKGKRAV